MHHFFFLSWLDLIKYRSRGCRSSENKGTEEEFLGELWLGVQWEGMGVPRITSTWTSRINKWGRLNSEFDCPEWIMNGEVRAKNEPVEHQDLSLELPEGNRRTGSLAWWLRAWALKTDCLKWILGSPTF